uniref:Cytochrome P450 n=1 Tax=Dunaliella tertiolecta TaxID=3047 RepID=A0A7S3R407_DUNTE
MVQVLGRDVSPVVVTAAFSTATAAVCYLTLRSRRRSRDEPPGPSFFIPFVGEMPAFASNPVKFVWDRYRRYNSSVFKSHLFGTRAYVVGDLEAIRGVLGSTENVESVIPIKAFSQIVSLYNTRGNVHRVFRKHMGLTLSPGNIKTNLPHFTQLVERHIESWVQSCERSPQGEQAVSLCLDDAVRTLLLELAVGPIMGLRTEPSQTAELLELITTVQAGIFAAPIYIPGTTWYRAITSRPRYMAMLKQLLTRRFPVDQSTGQLQPSNDRGGMPGIDTTKALMQEFKELQQTPTADDVAERLVQNMLGATETSYAQMWATILVLAARPDVQEKVRQEQAALMKASGQEVTWEDLQTGMPYTDACVREVARLVPSAHGVFRKAMKDLQVNGYTIPKGAPIIITLDLLTAQDVVATEKAQLSKGAKPEQKGVSEEELLGLNGFPVPLAMDHTALQHSFQPERWLSEDKPRHLHVFSHGAHYCLGKDLAIMEIKLAVTYLARRCTWALDPPGNPIMTFVPFTRLATGKPAMLRITPNPL